RGKKGRQVQRRKLHRMAVSRMARKVRETPVCREWAEGSSGLLPPAPVCSRRLPTHTRAPESANPPLGFRQLGNLGEVGTIHPGNHHLGNPHPSSDRKR